MTTQQIEDLFVAVISDIESGGNPLRWGDDGYACGRFQQHPSFYATWGPTVEEFERQERSWDWAFDVALRRYFRAAWADERLAKLGVFTRARRIAMSYHLHGSLVWTGWDDAYEEKFAFAWRERGGFEPVAKAA